MVTTSFEIRENSNHGGAPAFLYTFSFGNVFYHYTNADRNLNIDGLDYTATAISSTSVKQSGDATQDSMTITLPDVGPFTDLYAGSGPSEEVKVTIAAFQYGSVGTPIQFIGTISNHGRPQTGTIQFVCDYLTVSFDRGSGRLAWNRTCPHALYGSGCFVDRTLFAVPATLSLISGINVRSATFATFADDWFTGGYFEWLIGDGAYNRRSIDRHVGNNLLLLGLSDGLTVGQAVVAYPGCLRTTVICDGKFSNLANYGGFSSMPGNSPFDGDPVF